MNKKSDNVQQLHDFVKKNYEEGNYSRDYSYQQEQRREDDEQKQENLSDFDLGVRQFRIDQQNRKIRPWYFYRLLLILNKILGGRLREITDFIKGYRSEQKK